MLIRWDTAGDSHLHTTELAHTHSPHTPGRPNTACFVSYLTLTLSPFFSTWCLTVSLYAMVRFLWQRGICDNSFIYVEEFKFKIKIWEIPDLDLVYFWTMQKKWKLNHRISLMCTFKDMRRTECFQLSITLLGLLEHIKRTVLPNSSFIVGSVKLKRYFL